MDMLGQFLVFLPWCWAVNMSLTVFGFLERKVPFLGRIDRPIDLGASLGGNRILGESKTWGGLLFIIFVGAIGEWFFPGIHAAALAFLVNIGDMLGSFIKRRMGVARGGFVPVIDHGDYVITAGIYALGIGMITLPALTVFWLGTLAVTPAVTWLAHAAGIRERSL